MSPVIAENDATKSIDLIDTTVNVPILDNTVSTVEVIVNQTLATVDKLIESKVETKDEVIKQPSPKNGNFTEIMDSAIRDLIELQSKMASELLIIKDTVESKMDVIRKKINTAILENQRVAETALNDTKLSNDLGSTQSEKETVPDREKINILTESDNENRNFNSVPLKFQYDEDLQVKEEEIEANLAKMDDFIEFELEKIDSFVESELALTEALIRSEVDKINSLVESRLKTANLVKSERTNMESVVEPDLPAEIPVEGVAEFSGVVPATGRAAVFGNTGCMCESFNFIKRCLFSLVTW